VSGQRLTGLDAGARRHEVRDIDRSERMEVGEPLVRLVRDTGGFQVHAEHLGRTMGQLAEHGLAGASGGQPRAEPISQRC
jgi:hypothetical protein